jgi:hypothetical protein
VRALQTKSPGGSSFLWAYTLIPVEKTLVKTAIAFLTAVALGTAGPAFALYCVSFEGTWPKSWPRELEPLRKQARTLVGPEVLQRHYAIPFSKRGEFEAAWPHLLKVKSKGTPIFLVRAPNFFLGEHKAGVIVHSPPEGTNTPEAPLPSENGRVRWMYTTYLELIVDGAIVDLNRIPLPADTPIIDERFRDSKN